RRAGQGPLRRAGRRRGGPLRAAARPRPQLRDGARPRRRCLDDLARRPAREGLPVARPGHRPDPRPPGPAVTPELPARSASTFVDGVWLAGTGGLLTSLNPATAEPLATWTGSGSEQAEAAVNAARRSFDGGGWRRTPPAERAAVLRRLADL